VISFFTALIENSFLQIAFLVGLLASFTSGIVGSYVVIKRISFLAGSIAHCVLSGMGICLFLQYILKAPNIHPLYGAFISALLSALLIGWIAKKFQQRQDSVIAAIWSTGMAIGVIFIALTPATTVNLLDFLFGNILWVSKSDLLGLLLINLGIFLLVSLFYGRFLAICFDQTQLYLRKISITKTYLLLLSLIALSIVMLIKIMGIILLIAILTIPATISSLFTTRLSTMMFFAIVISMGIFSMGLFLAYQTDFPPGATIAILAAFNYGIALAYKK
jgi:zinc transport system permease protein